MTISHFADLDRVSLKGADIKVGDPLSPMDVALTPTLVASTAIASMDYMPVHHDKDYALAQFAPDIFLNILSSNGFVSRFLTDWAGPDAWVRKIAIKLGVPAVPNQILHFTGEVIAIGKQGEEWVVDVSVRASNDSGDHASGTATITLPE